MICVHYNSSKFNREKEYVLNYILDEFLGLEYTLKPISADVIVFEVNSNVIEFEDHFFSFSNESNVQSWELPIKIEYAYNEFTIEKDIPIIFGNTTCDFSNKTDSKTIHCGIDIVASIFFMLTRWEEIANPIKDQRDRFPAQASIAYKFGILDRPIVNEYIEMLWNMLLKLGYDGKRKEKNISFNPTHDIDHLSPFPILTIAEETLAYKKITLPLLRFKQMLTRENPYDTYFYFMDQSEKAGVKSTFYFMSNGKHFRDNRYDPKVAKLKPIVQSIIDKGHNIGLHPGYETYNNPKELDRQKTHLEKCFGFKINSARQHYLRFKTSDTWNHYESVNLFHDSSVAYPDEPGFRCGTSNEFQVFDVVQRKTLNVREKPPVIMDSMLYRMKISTEKQIEKISFYKDICKKYNMPYTFIVHNSSFDPVKWRDWYKIYPAFFES